MRLAGTMKQYSTNAIDQLTRMASHSADCLYLRCPYHAKVMKMLEIVSRMAVFMPADIGIGGGQRAGGRRPGETASPVRARRKGVMKSKAGRLACRRLCRSERNH